MADDRKAHIIRIKGVQKDEGGGTTELDDVWVDVRKIDEITVRDEGDGQLITREFAWDDGFTNEQPELERETTIIKLTNPEDPPADLEDPDIYIPLPVVDRLMVWDDDQRIFYEFANTIDPDNPTTREVTVKRVTFAETTPAEIPDPIDAADYSRDQDTVDDSQYLDVEVINTYKYDDADQVVNNELEQDDALLNQFEVSPEVNDNGEEIKPIRLDPLQNIVNVQWQKPLQVAFQWQSGADVGEGVEPRTRFYKTLFREPDRSGTDSGFIFDTLPDFTNETPRASDATDEQTEAVADLFDLEPTFNGGTVRMGRMAYFAGTGPSNSKFYSIDPEGVVKELADISDYTAAIPGNMEEVVEAGFALVELVAVPGALFFCWQRSGLSSEYTVPSEDPEVPPTTGRAALFAVTYIGIDLKGNLLANETITGPLISFADSSAGVSFTSAQSPSLDVGKFE